MLKAMFGISTAQECDVFWNGAKVKKPYAVRGLVHYLPQKDFLPKDLTLNKVLDQFKIEVQRIIYLFPELEKNLPQKTGDLSGGEERLWSALIIILAEGKFVLLDELFTGIMPLHISRLQQLIVAEKASKGFIITDHRYKDVLDICDKLYFMKAGRSFLLRAPEDLVMHGYLNQ